MQQLKTTIINYGNGIYAIDQQMVRAFLIVGNKKALLLDTGAVNIDIKKNIEQITNLPIIVVLTHGDGDHIGNLSAFDEAYCHEGDHQIILSRQLNKNIQLLPLVEGDIFDIGSRTLRVLLTPGHTEGSVCLIDEENKILFSGDTISYGPIFMFGARRNLNKYLQSLKRLKELEVNETYKTVYCCHNTCPISADIVDDLISCSEKIINHTIECVPSPIPFSTDEKPLLCKFGKCMILIDKLS